MPVLVGLLFGLTGLGSSSAAIALPVIGSDLGVSIGVGAWAISLYALMLAVATAVYGRISDLVGQRLPLLVGVSLMAVGALAGALAPNFGVLLGARIVQGAGAAAVPTLGVAIVTARFSGAARGVALGQVAGIAAAVSCLGPLAGGTIEGLLGWRAVIALPMLGALIFPLLWRWIPTNGSGARLDLFGAVLVAATAAGVVLLVQSPSTGSCRGRRRRRARACSASPRWPPGYAAARTASCRSEVIRNPVVVRSALAAGAVPAAWFALLIAVPAVLVGRRLGALAGRRRPDPERGDRAAGAPHRQPAAEPDRPDPLARPRRDRSPPWRSASPRSAPSSGSAVLLVAAVVARHVRLRTRPAGADGGRR